MATLVAHVPKLRAVNEILFTIGESPVNTLESGLADAALAERVLDDMSRQIQLTGWHGNTLYEFVINRNVALQIPLPINALKVDTVNPRSGRNEGSPTPSGHIDAAMRLSADKTLYLLFDVDNNRETWPNNSSLTVDMVLYLDWDELTPALQLYIEKVASRRFQSGAMASKVLYATTQRPILP